MKIIDVIIYYVILKKTKLKNMIIGIPLETTEFENRVSLTPYAVSTLRRRGNKILITHNAGIKSGYSNEEYKRAGAIILPYNSDVYENSEVIVKILPPTEDEVISFGSNKIIFSFLNLFSNEKLFDLLIQQRITAISFEEIKKEENYPILSSMSKIAGKLCFSIGSELLSKPSTGKGVLLGGSTSASRSKIVIIGAGNAGIELIKLGNNSGSRVSVFDNNIEKLNHISGTFSGVETFYPYHDLIIKEIKNADLVVGAIFSPKKKVNKIISKEMIKMMEKNSVIIDLTVDRGGIFETTRKTNLGNPAYVESNIYHYCVGNIAACVPKTASNAISTNILPYLLQITEGFLYKSPQLIDATLINKGIPLEYLEKSFIKEKKSFEINKLLENEQENEENWKNLNSFEDKFTEVKSFDDFEDFNNLDNPNEPEN